MICSNLRCLARSRPTAVSWCRLNAIRRLAVGVPNNTGNSKGVQKKVKKSYSDTLNLPKSQFPMKHSRQLELDVEKRTQFSDLYKDDLEHLQQKQKTFILHDGPPYANGDAHFGHCINKTLKDIFLKRQHLNGHDVHYVPGWDCHGLPIELKAITEDQAQELSPLEIRSRARRLATSAIDRQRNSFSSWYLTGGDHYQPYRTFDLDYSLAELNAFYRLYQSGLIFRDLMPVYWSPSTRTALAEAELQYNPEHVSLAAYIRYEVLGFPGNQKTYALIWTTTPWTLLANEGIAFSETIDYSLITLSGNSEDQGSQYLVATELIPSLKEKIPSSNINILRSGIFASELAGLRYLDPLNPAGESTEKRFFVSEHVNLNKGGTGLVHLAPNHGFDDYKLFQSQLSNSHVKKNSIVDGLGRLVFPQHLFNHEPIPITTGDNLASSVVLEKVLKPRGSVVHVEDHKHSYPYDWRSGKPVLIRPSSQWFLRIEEIRQQVLDALDTVKLYPEKLRKEFRHQIASRPNWCLSRQRHWGVPIPVFYSGSGADPDRLKPILTEQMFASVMDSFKKTGGLDAWWSCSAEELLGDSYPKDSGINLVKGEDIFDIWFDSGCSWLAVLPENQVSDLYSEGVDQIRGWFQSSLITSVALRGVAPYKAVFIHGFALDREGKKMSKSVGNVVDPNDIVEDRDLEKYLPQTPEVLEEEKDPKRKKKQVKKKVKPSSGSSCGLDGLRLWIAKHACSHNDVHVDVNDFGSDILSTLNRLRNTFRFLLGVLGSQNPQKTLLQAEDYHLMPMMDRYLLLRIASLQRLAEDSYAEYRLGDLVEKGVLKTLLHEVATFYLSRVKDRLYCEKADSFEFRSAFTVLWAVYHTAGHVLAPVTPHVILEANEELPFNKKELLLSVSKSEDQLDLFVKEVLFAETGFKSEEAFLKAMAPVFRIIETLNRWAVNYRLLEYDLVVATEDVQVLKSLKLLQGCPQSSFTSDLVELLQVASVCYQDGQLTGDDDQLAEDDDDQKRRYRLRPMIEGEEESSEEGFSSGEIKQVESTEFELELRPTKLILCPRCRRHTIPPESGPKDDQEECLCDRCTAAVMCL